jgi:L-threonylcarbamoyladenylate synthase
MPSLELAQEFLAACNLPVAAPSANISGRPSPTRWQDCVEDMDGRVGAILQGPEATHGLESTIVDCSGPIPVLLRPGVITLEELAELVPEIQSQPTDHSVTVPGMKYRHYAPRAKVILLPEGAKPTELEGPAAYIGLVDPTFPAEYQLVLDSPERYARKLFAFMRECDRRGMKQIYAQPVAEHGLGHAIMNRLNRAVAG